MNHHNRNVLICLIMGALAISAVVASVQMGNSPEKRFPRIKFGETTESFGEMTLASRAIPRNLPSKVRVYKVKQVSKKDSLLKLLKALPTTAESTNILHQLEQAPESLIQKEDHCSVSIGEWRAQVWDGGQFTIDKKEPTKSSEEWDDIAAAPTDAEARKAAEAFLIQIRHLLPDIHCEGVEPQETISRGVGPGDTIITRVAVVYSMMKDGIPFSHISIAVGAGPSVVSVVSHIRQVAPDSMISIISPHEAFNKLRKGEGHLGPRNDHCASGKVTSVKLAYYMGALAKEMTYIMPVYIFEGEDTRAKRTTHWSAYVEAASPECLEKKSAPR